MLVGAKQIGNFDFATFKNTIEEEKENSEEQSSELAGRSNQSHRDADHSEMADVGEDGSRSFNSVEEDLRKIYSEGEVADPVALTDRGFIDIGRIEPGGSFGALALIDGKPRMCTTKCLTRCHFLVLNKVDWLRAEKDIRKRKIEERVAFIK